MSQKESQATRRRFKSTVIAIVSVICVCSGCASHHPSIHRQPTSTSTSSQPFPSFLDWRVAYRGDDDRLHVVMMSGKTDIAGPTLPRFDAQGIVPGANLPDVAKASPDGYTIAYLDAIVHIHQQKTVSTLDFTPDEGLGTQISWSPDSKFLASNVNGAGRIAITNATSGNQADVPVAQNLNITTLIGWTDEGHLAVRALRPGFVDIVSVDISTGATRILASVAQTGLDIDVEQVSPDGTRILLYNRPFRDDPYTPIVEIIDVATGQTAPLPTIAQTLAHGFSTVAWKPKSDLIAASSGYLQNGDLQLWLLDTRQDIASKVTTDQYAYGWAPDGSALVVGTSASSILDDSATHIVSAVTFPSPGQPEIVPLTFSATTYPYMGFVRSASS